MFSAEIQKTYEQPTTWHTILRSILLFLSSIPHSEGSHLRGKILTLRLIWIKPTMVVSVPQGPSVTLVLHQDRRLKPYACVP